MKKWQMRLLIIIFGVQIILGLLIKYPPTVEQLNILLFFGGQGNFILWLLRVVSLGILFLTFRLWKGVVNQNVYAWSVLILSISPTIFNLWYLYPLLLLKIFLVILGFNLGKKFKSWAVVIFLIFGIIGFNRFGLNNKAAIFNKLSLSDAQIEVTARFTAEDSLKNKIEFPLWWRRISYNKYFFVYKQIVAEVLPYFDLESLFFQEVSPTEQKSMVMFYWPEILILVMGIYFCTKDKENNKLFSLLLFVSIFDYVFSEGAIDRRLLLTMWPLSIVMALTWVKSKKWILGVMGVLLFLGFIFNFYDLKVREEYWFDNRPLAFQFWFENLSKINLDNYQKIYVSSLVGDGKRYCYFYQGKKCDEMKWVFKSFDLEKEIIENKTIYAGFAGEFVGSKFKNDISNDWKKEGELKGLNFLSVKNLLNTIAYKYGNDIGVAIKD